MGAAAGDRATLGQAADTSLLEGLLDAVRCPALAGIGRPRVRPDYLVADKASKQPDQPGWAPRPQDPPPSPSATTNVPIAVGAAARVPTGFCSDQDRRRNQVELGFNRCKQLRAVATRSDKLTCCYEAPLTIASILDWFRASPTGHLKHPTAPSTPHASNVVS